jgi:hypothetical protein
MQVAESKLKALSLPVRLKNPDKRFESIKNYGAELQVCIFPLLFYIYFFCIFVKGQVFMIKYYDEVT